MSTQMTDDGIKLEIYRRDHHDPRVNRSYMWGRDYGKDILRDLNEMAHTANVGCLQRDLLQRAFKEITRLRNLCDHCDMCGEMRDGRDHSGCDRAYPETLK